MHITRCDDPAYLSFARQLLRSLSNVKNGTVTKYIGDVTVTVRKVFGHEYVSIASGDVVYEFFTTGDLYNTLEGLDLVQLARTDHSIIPRGYFIRAKSNGDAQLFLSTNEPFIGEKAVPYINQHAFFDKARRVNRPLQVSLITEPVYESSFGHRCFSVWSQRPTPYTDVKYDIVGNRLHGLSTKPHVVDTDWPRTVATTTRVHTDVNGVKTKVGLMVVVTQTWDVVIYKISDASEPMYDHPTYPQLGLTTKPGAGVVKLQIPTPAGMEKNTFDGSARETYGSNKEAYTEKYRKMCVRINPDCTKLCFNYDEIHRAWEPRKLNCFVEFELTIDLEESGDIVASLQKLQSIDSGMPRMRVLDCDYLMPSKGGLAKKFEDLGCKTGDLIVLCQYVTAEAIDTFSGIQFMVDDNCLYFVNQTTGVVLIEIPSECSAVDSEKFGQEVHTLFNINMYFEFIDLKSLSFALTIEDARGDYLGGQGVGNYKAAYALFVHGKKFASAGAFDVLFNTPVKKQNSAFPLADLWCSQLDPTHNFVCDTFGNWSYHSFFYSDFFGTRFLTDVNGVTGASDESLCLRKTFTHPKNMLMFTDAFAFDFVVFATKNANGYTEKITSHKQLFEKATGLNFNTRWRKGLISYGQNTSHIVAGGSGVERNEAWGQAHGSMTFTREILKAYPVYQQHQDSTLFVNCPIVSAVGLFG